MIELESHIVSSFLSDIFEKLFVGHFYVFNWNFLTKFRVMIIGCKNGIERGWALNNSMF